MLWRWWQIADGSHKVSCLCGALNDGGWEILSAFEMCQRIRDKKHISWLYGNILLQVNTDNKYVLLSNDVWCVIDLCTCRDKLKIESDFRNSKIWTWLCVRSYWTHMNIFLYKHKNMLYLRTSIVSIPLCWNRLNKKTILN